MHHKTNAMAPMKIAKPVRKRGPIGRSIGCHSVNPCQAFIYNGTVEHKTITAMTLKENPKKPTARPRHQVALALTLAIIIRTILIIDVRTAVYMAANARLTCHTGSPVFKKTS